MSHSRSLAANLVTMQYMWANEYVFDSGSDIYLVMLHSGGRRQGGGGICVAIWRRNQAQ